MLFKAYAWPVVQVAHGLIRDTERTSLALFHHTSPLVPTHPESLTWRNTNKRCSREGIRLTAGIQLRMESLPSLIFQIWPEK